MQNSLLEDSFIQYKCKEYKVGEYYKQFNSKTTMGNTVTKIKAVNPHIFEPINFSLEPTIQRLCNEVLPLNNDNEAWTELSLQLTRDYGFLYLPRHIQSLNDDIELNQYTSLYINSSTEHHMDNPYQGEEISEWKRFITTLQYSFNRISNPSFLESISSEDKFFYDGYMQMYLDEIKPTYDFETQSISLKCDSLASAIMLSIVSNNKHLKSCIKCSKLFYAGRSDAKYCDTTCGRSNQGSRRGKSKEL